MSETGTELAERLFADLLAATTDEPGVTRASFGPGEAFAHRLAADAARAMDMEVSRDAAGNQYMTWPGVDRALPRVFVGSHMDSVAHGGNFDGAAGVVMGLAAVRDLKAAGHRPARDVVVMAIRAEEMVWFPLPYCGSRMAFGILPAADYDGARRSDTGRSLAYHMHEEGFDPDAMKAGHRPLDPATIHCFIEPHIEQGPILETEGLPVAIVTGIRGNHRHRWGRITGRTDHAGAVPRDYRQDAVLAGAALLTALEAFWDARDAAGDDFVATVGQFHTDPVMHGITKVPGDIAFTLDLRSLDDRILADCDQFLREAAARIGRERRVAIDLGDFTQSPSATMDPGLMATLDRLAADLGIDVRHMASGAGHDCATFAAMGVRSAMLFVRNQNGSHNPHEAMRMDDFEKATRLLAGLVAHET